MFRIFKNDKMSLSHVTLGLVLSGVCSVSTAFADDTTIESSSIITAPAKKIVKKLPKKVIKKTTTVTTTTIEEATSSTVTTVGKPTTQTTNKIITTQKTAAPVIKKVNDVQVARPVVVQKLTTLPPASTVSVVPAPTAQPLSTSPPVIPLPPAPAPAASAPKIWTLVTDIGYGTDFKNDDKHSNSLTVDVIPSVKFGDFKLKSVLEWSNGNFNGASDNKYVFQDIGLSLGYKPFKVSSEISDGLSVKATLPTSETSQNVTKKQLGLSMSNNLSYSPEKIKDLNLAWTLTGATNFYQSDFDVTGAKPNTLYSVSNSFNLSYSLSDQVGLGAYFNPSTSWHAQGANASSYTVGFNLGYTPATWINFSVELSNSGKVWKQQENNQDLGVSVFSRDSAGLGFTVEFVI
jgi:hypothetical protein